MSSPNAIDALFQRLRAQRRKAFIPFITAGDPDIPATVQLAHALVQNGADLIEIGFPYSDPIADGPVIQASYTRALDRGVHVADMFACARQIAELPEVSTTRVPLVAMVSCSLIHRRGHEAFLDQAQASGLSGAIVPDLPFDESAPLAQLAAARDFKLIHLVTPTTPQARAAEIARRSTGFLYCVSVTGITGERERVPDEIMGQLEWLRSQTALPLCVGFGISKPDHVRLLREVADGIIVGSALVRRLEQIPQRPAAAVIAEIGALVSELCAALNPVK